jgi:hypothetical protein
MGKGVEFKLTLGAVVAVAAALFAALGLGLIATERASAQGPGSEFCEEYPSIPGCETGPTGDTGPTGTTGTTGIQAPTAGSVDAGGTLPFTGYPLTALILLLLILLLIGLAIRAYLAVRDRISGDPRAGA